jgi:hypothetical protein
VAAATRRAPNVNADIELLRDVRASDRTVY